MNNSGSFCYGKFIITWLASLFIAFFLFDIPGVRAEEEGNSLTVSSCDELIASLNQLQNTGGTIVLTDDIIIPESETLTFNNARYKKEILIETNGYTFYVEGYLEFWPYLTIRGDGNGSEIFHIVSGGELWLISISIDAGEDGVAVVQEEGSFLVYSSEEAMGLPEFSCIGKICSAQTMAAAAYWAYNPEQLPVVRVPVNVDFDADMLPAEVLSLVNRDHQQYEEQVPVIWDDTTFPSDCERTIVKGRFADGYSQYGDYQPQCLVVWESDTSPFFLNVYLETATQWYDMVFIHGEVVQTGTVSIQSSNDGENWVEIEGTNGYKSVEAVAGDKFSWILSYDKTDPSQERPIYYRMMQILEDGTETYSEVLELEDGMIFTGADIEGSRGGETSPNEGENQLQREEKGTEEPENIYSLNLHKPTTGQKDVEEENRENGVEQSEKSGDLWEKDEPSSVDIVFAAEEETQKKGSGEYKDQAGFEKVIGMIVFGGIVAGTVAFSLVRRKK